MCLEATQNKYKSQRQFYCRVRDDDEGIGLGDEELVREQYRANIEE